MARAWITYFAAKVCDWNRDNSNAGLLNDVTHEQGLQNGGNDTQNSPITQIHVFMFSKGVLYHNEV